MSLSLYLFYSIPFHSNTSFFVVKPYSNTVFLLLLHHFSRLQHFSYSHLIHASKSGFAQDLIFLHHPTLGIALLLLLLLLSLFFFFLYGCDCWDYRQFAAAASAGVIKKSALDSGPKQEAEFTMQKLVDMFAKLNPSAKEFFPSHHSNQCHPNLPFHPNANFILAESPDPKENLGIDLFPNDRRRRGNFNQGRTRFNGRSFRAQREDNIRRTVYVSDINHLVTEEQLANMFSVCGQVLDCRICGDPHSVLRFAFVEFADEYGSRAALSLGGMTLGFYPVRVLPSKTAILPVNPSYLPRSQDEREMCARTVYCTNIDKKVSHADVQNFFETACGKVTRLRLLGDHVHSTRIAFVEFAVAESAIAALSCSGMVLGTQPIRVSASKTPVRPRVARPLEY